MAPREGKGAKWENPYKGVSHILPIPGIKAETLGPLLRVRFTYLEFPGADLSFSYEGWRFGPLEDGNVYELPEKVVYHLNSLGYPKTALVVDQQTGQTKHVSAGKVSRMACVPVGQEAKNEPRQPPQEEDSCAA